MNLPSYDDIMRMIAARRKLDLIVKARRSSFECQDYARRREAMLSHTRKARAG